MLQMMNRWLEYRCLIQSHSDSCLLYYHHKSHQQLYVMWVNVYSCIFIFCLRDGIYHQKWGKNIICQFSHFDVSIAFIRITGDKCRPYVYLDIYLMLVQLLPFQLIYLIFQLKQIFLDYLLHAS